MEKIIFKYEYTNDEGLSVEVVEEKHLCEYQGRCLNPVLEK